jgi:hypothetical protein
VKRRISLEEETAGIEEMLARAEEAAATLQALLKSLAGQVRATDEPPLMPNYQRAEEQLRIALNATLGAQRSLRRRLDLRRGLAATRRAGFPPTGNRKPSR